MNSPLNPYESPESPSSAATPKNKSADRDMQGGDWFLAILCSGIGCILGIIWIVQGKPKGGKMLGVSFLFAVIWNLLRAVVESSLPTN